MRRLFLFTLVLGVFSGCTINNSIILKSDRDFVFDSIPEEMSTIDYRISPNDVVEFRLFANEGFKLIDVANSTQTGNNQLLNRQGGFTYVVETDSMVNLPIVGRMKLAGMTLKEAEVMLEDKFSAFYNRPYVILNVSNRRVIVFPGSGGGAKVVSLRNNNTTLLEVIASAGGVADRGRSKSIRLIRGENDDRKVYNIDLSTMEGLKYIDIIVQANDVIYIEPAPELARELLKDATPVITLITSAITVWLVVNRGL